VYVRLKSNKASKHSTVQVVESFREGKKVKQKIIASLGVIRDESDKQRLIAMGHALISKLSQSTTGQSELFSTLNSATPAKATKAKGLVNPKDLVHIRNQPCGQRDVYGALSVQIGFDGLLKKIDDDHKHEFSVQQIVPMIVEKRLMEPASKRRSLFLETVEMGATPCGLHQIYRTMDVILPYADQFQAIAYQAAITLLDSKVECFFYDATTLYFESVRQDEIRNFGFGKDGKFNQVQILFCLLVTPEGLPVGYEIFKGNTGETNTFQTAIENLSKRFNVTRATIVCDRGMLSGANLKFAEESAKMNYIIGEKLRKLPAVHQSQIFDSAGYVETGDIQIKEITHPTRSGARLILVYSKDRAKKDKQDRERLLAKLEKRLTNKKSKPKDFVSNAGIKKYVTLQGGTATLNREAILKDEKWDGYFGIVTNHQTLPAKQVLSQYRGLWQVEAAFRITKHDLATRPIFHWTPDRIRAHVLLCFNALVLERHLELILQKRGTPLTATQIQDALGHCEKILFQDQKSNRLFEMDRNKPAEAKVIYEALGLPLRAETRELLHPGGSVVPMVHSVMPQAYGIAPV
jgi:transposase